MNRLNRQRRDQLGTPERRQLSQIIAATDADELIVAGALHQHSARLRSYEILAGLRQDLAAAQAT